MELYKELADKCEIEKNSRVYIPNEALQFFVRLIIMDYARNKKNSYIALGYTSGLFDGSGAVCSKSVEKYYKEINKETEEIDKKFEKKDIYKFFGVAIEYTEKNNNIKKRTI